MKKYIFILLALTACNNEIATNVSPSDQLQPDYNLLAEAHGSMILDQDRAVYSSTASIYLRPFENVRDIDLVTLQFSSNHLARFVVMGDTLYTGDKKNVLYTDFNKYLLDFQYESQVSGQHNITINTTIKKVSKQTNVTLNTIEI